MNGGVTHQDLSDWKRKAAAYDKALAYLECYADNEASVIARDILRMASIGEPK